MANLGWDPSMSNDGPWNDSEWGEVIESVEAAIVEATEEDIESITGFLDDSKVEKYMDKYQVLDTLWDELNDSKAFAKAASDLIYQDVYADILKQREESNRKLDTDDFEDLYNNTEELEEAKNFKQIKKLLKEADDEVEKLDTISLMQDLADVDSSLADSLAKMYVYKMQYIDNQGLKQAIAQIRVDLSLLMKKIGSTMSIVGTDGDHSK